jgi:hypothetical protein
MEKYIGVPVNNHITPNSVLSPFRQDTPTCNYYYLIDKTGYAKLRFRDWMVHLKRLF